MSPCTAFLRHQGISSASLHARVQPEVSKVAQPVKVHAVQAGRPEFNPCIPSGSRELTSRSYIHTHMTIIIFKTPVCLVSLVGSASSLTFRGLSSEALPPLSFRCQYWCGVSHCCYHVNSKGKSGLSHGFGVKYRGRGTWGEALC